MELDVKPLQPREVDEFTAIHWEAFSPPEANMTLPMIYPLGYQDDLKQRLRNRVLNAMDNREATLCQCVKDPSSGKLIGVSWWSRVGDGIQGEETVDQRYRAGKANRRAGVDVEGMNQAMEDAFFKAAFDTETEIMGSEAYMTLKLLAVRPGYAGKGIGTSLLRRGLQKVDELGLPAFIHSGTHAKPLYERHGFEALRDMPANALDYGGRSDGIHWCMRRLPRKPVVSGSELQQS